MFFIYRTYKTNTSLDDIKHWASFKKEQNQYEIKWHENGFKMISEVRSGSTFILKYKKNANSKISVLIRPKFDFLIIGFIICSGFLFGSIVLEEGTINGVKRVLEFEDRIMFALLPLLIFGILASIPNYYILYKFKKEVKLN